MSRKIMQYIDYGIEGGAVIAFSGMCIAILVQVAARFVHYPTPWAEELSRFLNVWAVFLASAWAVKKGTHLSVRAILDRLPHRWQQRVSLGIDLSVILMLAAMCWGSIIMMRSSYTMLSGALQLRMSYFYLGLCVGSVAMFFYYLLQIITTISAMRKTSPSA